jgi:hypothetical protein
VPRGGAADDGLPPKDRSQETAATVASTATNRKGERAPLDRVKLLALAPADVADPGDAPDMLGSG